MEEQRKTRCIQSLKQAIKTLHEKAYHDEVQKAADFVVLYVPREWMYTIALEKGTESLQRRLQQECVTGWPL